jgi:2-keto-4-pentenoate hydratase/2-oxohepta-3-ene-1,7-dioic acid hydratase in catechol pathway
MRLVSYVADGGPPRSGVLVGTDRLADLATVTEQAGLGPSEQLSSSTVRGFLALGPSARQAVESALALGTQESSLPLGTVRLGPPIADPQKIVCLGLNYRDHAAETGMDIPDSPVVFAKYANSLIGPHDDIVLPAVASEAVDYEAELAVVIGSRTRKVAAAEALAHVAGVMAFNDVSARDLQMSSSQWTLGKAVDTFGPCGPTLVSLDEIGDLQALSVRARVNGVTVQDGSTSDMIFRIADIISMLSMVMTLEPGDIIATGTPAGVGYGRTPPLMLQPGDVVEVDIPGVGLLQNAVIADSIEEAVAS